MVLQSGSRGIGNQLAQSHIARGRRLGKDLELRLEDPDLAWFVEGTPEFTATSATCSGPRTTPAPTASR